MVTPAVVPTWSRFQYTGTLRGTSFYIERAADLEIFERLASGQHCSVFAPRQIGKSSLVSRAAARLRERGAVCASVDLTSVGAASTREQWYFGLMAEVAKRLQLPYPRPFWDAHDKEDPVRRWTSFLHEVVVSTHAAGKPVVLFFDEIEAIRTRPFSLDDFLLSLRSTTNHGEEASALTFCVIGVTTPNDLVTDKLVTPPNTFHAVRLTDFSRADLDALAPGLDALGARTAALLDSVFAWTAGHPYMTMRTCAGLAQRGSIPRGEETSIVDEVVFEIFLERPFDDPNLNYAARRFDDPKFAQPGVSLTDKVALYRKILEGIHVPANMEAAVQMELRLCGLVKEVRDDNGTWLTARNQVFATVLDKSWLRTKGQRRYLSEAVWNWLENNKSPHALLRGQVLEWAVEWARSAILSEDENAFLEASKRAETEALDEQKRAIESAVKRALDEKEAAEQAAQDALEQTQAVLVQQNIIRATAETEKQRLGREKSTLEERKTLLEKEKSLLETETDALIKRLALAKSRTAMFAGLALLVAISATILLVFVYSERNRIVAESVQAQADLKNAREEMANVREQAVSAQEAVKKKNEEYDVLQKRLGIAAAAVGDLQDQLRAADEKVKQAEKMISDQPTREATLSKCKVALGLARDDAKDWIIRHSKLKADLEDAKRSMTEKDAQDQLLRSRIAGQELELATLRRVVAAASATSNGQYASPPSTSDLTQDKRKD